MKTDTNKIVGDSIKTIRADIRNIVEGLSNLAKHLSDISPAEYQTAKQLTQRALSRLVRQCGNVIGLTNNIQLKEYTDRLEVALNKGFPDFGSNTFDSILVDMLEIDRACHNIAIERDDQVHFEEMIQTLIALSKDGFKMVLDNQPLTIEAVRRWSASQVQSAADKRTASAKQMHK